MIQILEYHTVIVDGCAAGVVSQKTGGPIHKPWRFETDCDLLREKLEKFKCLGDHDHTPCMSGEAKASGHYPRPLSRTFVKAVFEYHLRNWQTDKEYATMVAEEKTRVEMSLVATKEETEAFMKLPAKEREKLINAARKIHVNTGHRPVDELARILRKQGVPPESRAAMESVKCSSCQENKRPESSPIVSLKCPSVPFKNLSMDIKEITDKTSKYKFLVIVCDATRFARAIRLHTIPRNQHKNTSTEEVLQHFEEGWQQIFGLPAEIRTDPEGAFVSNELIEEMSRKGVKISPTAGEAHWQNGLVERLIQTIFSTTQRVMSELKVPLVRAVALATAAHNHVETVYGFTPAQWALGRAPNWADALHEEAEDLQRCA
jgi:hypothetical protein